MTVPEELTAAGRTETTVRRFDKDGRLVEEHTTVITHMEPKPDDNLRIGHYL